MRIEKDHAVLVAGTRKGLTLGSPLALSIENRDATIEDLPVPTDPRPGHADLAGCQRMGNRDPRAIMERASARETAMRVALGGVARQVLEAFGIEIFAHVLELGGIPVRPDAWEAAGAERHAIRAASAFQSLDPDCEQRLTARVDGAREAGDSLGGVFEVRVMGLPPGIGSHMSGPERLTSRLGGAFFSIPAMKGVEFGLGFESARLPGSQVHDAIVPARKGAPWGRFARASNRAGGLEGGLTTGEPLLARVAMKPIPTLRAGVPSVDFESGEATRSTYQRSDVTSVPAASVVGEAVAALELGAAFLEAFSGASMDHVRAAWEDHLGRLRKI